YIWVYHHFPTTFYHLSLLRFLLSFSILLIPTFLMGGTLPVITKLFVRRTEELGGKIGILYAVNTFGAVIGTFSAGFFLLGTLGIQGTLYTASLINFLIAGVAWMLSRTAPASDLRQKKVVTAPRGVRDHPPYVVHFILWAIFFSGLASLAYQVIWTRVLIIILQGTTYSFTTMLTTFLCGLALGSLLVTKFIDTRRDLLFLFGMIEILIGLSALLLLPLFSTLPDLLYAIRNQLGISWWKVVGMGFLASFFVMLVPTILMGATFPLAVKLYTTNLKRVGGSVGIVYAANTTGAILGSFAVGFVLIPLIGIQGSNLIAAFVNISLGAIAIAINPFSLQKTKWAVTLPAAAILLLSFFIAPTHKPVITPTSLGPGDKLLFYKEDMAGTVSVIEQKRSGVRLCYVNSNFVCGTSYDALKTIRMLGHLPLLLHPNPRSVLVIGFGMGVTTWSVTQHPIEKVVVVELSPAVVDASKYFSQVNHNVLNDPRVRLVEGDGRNYLLMTDERYDVITCDPTHPLLGSGNLYTRDYFELCKERLTDGGIIVQYLPLHLLSPEDLKTAISTFKEVFPHTTVWFAFSHGILVGTEGRLKIDYTSLKRRLSKEKIRQSLKESDLNEPFAFLSCFLLGEDGVDRFVARARINTDDRPRIEFSGQRSIGVETWSENLSRLLPFRGDVSTHLSHIEVEEEAEVRSKLSTIFSAGEHSLRGRVLYKRGRVEEAISEYRQTLEIYPEDEETKRWLKFAMEGF
ncbi:fused MFS/spermidine synthase, partial [candidate division TA06 bacterium]|nr:fused MFS/spermidine synthase [candidate division TA06 bacterium]